jgi:hypothetical protein
MKTVFIGGSRHISRLNDDIRQRIDHMIEQNLRILVGDANGADKAVQTYLSSRHYPNVAIFCTAGECRNNLGRWPIVAVPPPHRYRDFLFFTAKDSAMAREADVGLMLWDGKSSGTIVNVARMVAAAKPVVVYVSPRKSFLTVKSRQDMEALVSLSSSEARKRIEEYILEYVGEFTQSRLF